MTYGNESDQFIDPYTVNLWRIVMKTNFEDYLTQLAPGLAAAEKATVFLLTCMDYRYAHRITDLMDSKGLRRKYDIFVLAGAAAGANEDEKWREVLVEHIKTARLVGHPIDRIMILEHRDWVLTESFLVLNGRMSHRLLNSINI